MEHTKSDILAKLSIRVKNFNSETLIWLWNKYAEKNGYNFIVDNEEINLCFLSSQYNKVMNIYLQPCDLLKSLRNGNVKLEDPFLAVNVKGDLISLNEEGLKDFIRTDELIDWVYSIVKEHLEKNGANEDEDIELFYDEIINPKAYTFINTTESNTKNNYCVKTKEVDGIPLFDIEGWDWEELITLDVGSVKYSDSWSGAMVVRVK